MAEQYDYESIRNRILTNLSSKTEHQNVFSNGAIVNLIEAISEELEDEMLQDEYLTTENNWGLAQNKSSLLTESKVHNYSVPRKRGAIGILKLGVSEDYLSVPTSIIDIPQWSQFSTEDNVLVSTFTANSFPITESSIEVEVVQGEPKTYSTFANGSSKESFIISNNSIDNNYYSVYVNDNLWEVVDSLFDYTGDDNVLELTSLSDFSGVKLQFGDGIYGKILTSGDSVRFEYIETAGSSGNIVRANQVTNVESTIYNVNGETVELFCTNEDSIAGGEDEASLEEIRENSPRFFQSGDRATSREDYETLIEAFSFIKKVKVIGAYEYNLDNGNDLWNYIPTEDNLVKVIALSTTNEGLTESQQASVTNLMYENSAPTDILTYPEVSVIPMIFNMDIAVSSRDYSFSDVKSSIGTALEGAYNLTDLEFFESVYTSDYYRLIDSVEGVRKHKTYITIPHYITFDTAYAESFNLPLYPLDGNSIKVYVRTNPEDAYILIGQGDSSGFIIGELGYEFSTLSRIDLNTGEGTMSVLNGLDEDYTTYSIKVEYQLTDTDVTLVSRSQILYYESANYTNMEYYTGG